MKKSDLKTGMRVTTRDDSVYTVLLNFSNGFDMLVNPYGTRDWDSLNSYNEDLTDEDSEEFDIVKIEKPEHAYAVFDEKGKYRTIWERQKPKEMTLTEIEQELGYPIKIID